VNIHRTRCSSSRGFTLVEVLVSLAVFGIGLLGLGKMLLVSMKSNGSSFSHAQAMVLANAMIDRIRANRTTALQGSSSNYSLPTLASTVGTAPDCQSATCSGAQLATYDVSNWLSTLSAANGLPNAQGQIVFNQSTSQTTVTVTIQWDDSITQQALKESIAPASVNLTSGL
jgi:type IV pilus assembly protein PilV